MPKVGNILEGWGKSYGLLKVTPENRALSEARLTVCDACRFAEHSRVLKLLRGKAVFEKTLYCNAGCGCPIVEKSLVPSEKCPKNYWEDNK